jgi:hypothetical protein
MALPPTWEQYWQLMGMWLRLRSLLQPIKMGKKCHVIETGKVFGV